jgi:hypothetical protein
MIPKQPFTYTHHAFHPAALTPNRHQFFLFVLYSTEFKIIITPKKPLVYHEEESKSGVEELGVRPCTTADGQATTPVICRLGCVAA